MNEWGIPDWRQVENYGRIEEWSKIRWEWEFARRREDVRIYFDARADSEYLRNQEAAKYDPKLFGERASRQVNSPGFCVGVHPDDVWDIGYHSLPNPRIGPQPELSIFPANVARRTQPVSSNYSSGRIEEHLSAAGVVLTEEQRWKLGDGFLNSTPLKLKANQVAMVFETRLPLKPQLETAADWLKHEYEVQGFPTQRRPRPDKWISYLRVIDARNDEASWREISEILPFTAGSEQSARDTWEAATSLRFNF